MYVLLCVWIYVVILTPRPEGCIIFPSGAPGVSPLHFALVGGCVRGFLLCVDGLHLRCAEEAVNPCALLGGGVEVVCLEKCLAFVDHFIAESLPAAPCVGGFGYACRFLRCVVRLDVCPRHSEGCAEAHRTLAEDLPCAVHDLAEIVLHFLFLLCVGIRLWEPVAFKHLIPLGYLNLP